MINEKKSFVLKCWAVLWRPAVPGAFFSCQTKLEILKVEYVKLGFVYYFCNSYFPWRFPWKFLYINILTKLLDDIDET